MLNGDEVSYAVSSHTAPSFCETPVQFYFAAGVLILSFCFVQISFRNLKAAVAVAVVFNHGKSSVYACIHTVYSILLCGSQAF